MEPIGPIGINSLGHVAANGPWEPIGPIGINSTYRANWADWFHRPNWRDMYYLCQLGQLGPLAQLVRFVQMN